MLVAYASKAGSTGEVTEVIGRVLCDEGAAVEVKPIREVDDPSGYGAVVVGGAVRMGRWLPDCQDGGIDNCRPYCFGLEVIASTTCPWSLRRAKWRGWTRRFFLLGLWGVL
jgi:flavodoxin